MTMLTEISSEDATLKILPTDLNDAQKNLDEYVVKQIFEFCGVPWDRQSWDRHWESLRKATVTEAEELG